MTVIEATAQGEGTWYIYSSQQFDSPSNIPFHANDQDQFTHHVELIEVFH